MVHIPLFVNFLLRAVLFLCARDDRSPLPAITRLQNMKTLVTWDVQRNARQIDSVQQRKKGADRRLVSYHPRETNPTYIAGDSRAYRFVSVQPLLRCKVIGQ